MPYKIYSLYPSPLTTDMIRDVQSEALRNKVNTKKGSILSANENLWIIPLSYSFNARKKTLYAISHNKIL